MIQRKTHSAKETYALGKIFSKSLIVGDVVVLRGPLGVGKTTFIKGILGGFGIKNRDILSPSFILIREYKKKGITINHIDLYRIKTKKELLSLGYNDYFYAPQAITLIEWGERIKHMLDKFIKVDIAFLNFNSRKIKLSLRGYPKNKLKIM